MKRSATILMCIMALIFVISGLIFATSGSPFEALPRQLASFSGGSDPTGLATIYLRPEHPAMWLMLAALWIAVTLFAARRVWPRKDCPDLDLPDASLMTAAFAAGAIWPWLSISAPLAGFLLCVLMLLALIAAARRRDSDDRLARHPLLGLFAGWTTVVTFAAFTSFLTSRTGIPVELATGVAAVLTCAAAIAIQLRIPSNPAYTITVMFTYLATAATLIETNPPLSVISVLAIAALTFLLVRVTT